MVELIRHIPTNVITGFLGVGKTTAVLHLLKHKPATERWAVLVNEFGQIGIDGQILEQDGVAIKELPGGCMCCAAGVSVQVGINALLANSRPDRLLIEPTGIGHPKQIIKQLTQPPFDQTLAMRACITLIDPRHLDNPRYRENEYYREQLDIADVLVANKVDQCDDAQLAAFAQLVETRQPGASGQVSHGQLQLAWLDLPHARRQDSGRSLVHARAAPEAGTQIETVQLEAGESWRRLENRSGEFAGCGWLFAEQLRFDYPKINSLLTAMSAERIKASLRTDQGDYLFNSIEGDMQVSPRETPPQNRIEIIMQGDPDWDKVEDALLSCLI
ncbi:CobW family GTP-binding protein [Thiohalophilus thiocyanatoxydans]|uniref:G3E family GTPase n=1 Tax=Thiohalophilus thiocyanatoxydans TaxID=381308 RepID=A0A4R8IYC6_9GAMM|nr:GTP-binding protein [Thiohalophilus thiocyanatoxydans]TDY02937.1 G3E family GTPase [Thiohalophilus thiocyanatoxydans]